MTIYRSKWQQQIDLSHTRSGGSRPPTFGHVFGDTDSITLRRDYSQHRGNAAPVVNIGQTTAGRDVLMFCADSPKQSKILSLRRFCRYRGVGVQDCCCSPMHVGVWATTPVHAHTHYVRIGDKNQDACTYFHLRKKEGHGDMSLLITPGRLFLLLNQLHLKIVHIPMFDSSLSRWSILGLALLPKTPTAGTAAALNTFTATTSTVAHRALLLLSL